MAERARKLSQKRVTQERQRKEDEREQRKSNKRRAEERRGESKTQQPVPPIRKSPNQKEGSAVNPGGSSVLPAGWVLSRVGLLHEEAVAYMYI